MHMLMQDRYGINNFVYTSRRPFHSKRLWDLLHDKFILLQNGDNEDEDGEENEDEDGDEEMQDDDDEEEEEEQEEESLEKVPPCCTACTLSFQPNSLH